MILNTLSDNICIYKAPTIHRRNLERHLSQWDRFYVLHYTKKDNSTNFEMVDK
jgi:hypothetical protein